MKLHYKNKSLQNIDNEKWVDISGYEKLYAISSYGRVMSLDRIVLKKNGLKRNHRCRILSQRDNNKGYLDVILWKNNKSKHFSVARLVIIHFIPNKSGGSEVNHINGIPKDNSLSNLEWTDRSGNLIHSYRVLKRKPKTTNATLSRSKKVHKYSITGKYIKSFNTVRAAAKSVSTSSSAISKCCIGVYKSMKGFKWRHA